MASTGVEPQELCRTACDHVQDCSYLEKPCRKGKRAPKHSSFMDLSPSSESVISCQYLYINIQNTQVK